MTSLAASPAAAAYDAAAFAPAPATTAKYHAGSFYAASPSGAQKLAQIDSPSGAIGGDSLYAIIMGKAEGGKGPKQFASLKAMVDKAGLADQLNDPSFKGTLLAPSDEAITAFAAKAGKTPGDILNDRPEVIKALLLQHLLVETRDQPAPALADLRPGQTYPTKGEAGVRVDSVDPVRLRVAGGPGDDITTAERGVATPAGAHVISVNRVLLPPQSTFQSM